MPDLSQPFAITAAIAVGGFLAYFIKDVITDLRKRLDASEARVSALTTSVDKMSDVIKDGLRDLRP